MFRQQVTFEKDVRIIVSTKERAEEIFKNTYNLENMRVSGDDTYITLMPDTYEPKLVIDDDTTEVLNSAAMVEEIKKKLAYLG